MNTPTRPTHSFPSLLLLLLLPGLLDASPLVLWGNGAGSSRNLLQAFELPSGDKLADFSGPNPDARGFFGGDAGRGIAVHGGIVYYTSSGSGKIFRADAVTQADLGFVFDTGWMGVRSVSFDGSTFWVRDDFSHELRRYTPDGTLLASLPNFTSSFDVHGDRIAARDATGVGLFDLAGSLVRHLFDYDFSDNHYDDYYFSRGLAFDGAHIAFQGVDLNRILTYDLTGTFLYETVLGGRPICCDDRDYVDLAFSDGTAPPVPEPGTLILLGAGLATLGLLRVRRTRRRAQDLACLAGQP